MKIFLVCSTSKSWMNTGYGHSLLQGEMPQLLVSFVEFAKDPDQQLRVDSMVIPYIPGRPKEKGNRTGRLPVKADEENDHGN